VIKPGWLPGARARDVLGRTVSYTRRRKRRRSPPIRPAVPASVVNTEIVLFDHGPAEFPTATAVPREARARAIAVAADLKRWLLARWDWFRPRSVPCAVACLGMLATLKSAEYLAHQHHAASSAPAHAHVVHVQIAPR
jgi:hypothetical protein